MPIRATSAAGSVRQLDPSITASRALNFFAYTWGEISELPAKTQSGMLEKFQSYGFKVNPLVRRCETLEEILKFYRDIESKRAKLGYDIDGVVYKVDRLDLQERLGFVSPPPALGHRPQIPRRTGRDGAGGYRDPGRPHRQAGAGGAAEAGHGGRGGGAERHLAQ